MTGQRVEAVFDHSAAHVYLTNDGFVRVYNIATGQFEADYNLGGNVTSMDIAADDSFLLVAQDFTTATQGIIHKIDLRTRAITDIYYDLTFSEGGPWAVRIASNGLAFFTTSYQGAGETPVRQIDLLTNAVTIRNDVPELRGLVTGATQIERSADRTRLYFIELGVSNSPVFTYDAATNAFSRKVDLDLSIDYTSGAVNRTGTLLATRMYISGYSGATLDNASDLTFVHSFGDPDSGMAFDAVTDTLYATVSATNQIVAYDTNTYTEIYRWDIGEYAGPGNADFNPLVASPDGRYLLMETASGFRLFDVPGPATPRQPPSPTASTRRGMVFDPSSQHLYIATSTGWVQRFSVPGGQFETAYNIGGSLNDLDIAPDGSFLVVGQKNPGIATGAFQKLDLATGKVTNLTYPRDYYETGAWDVAIASNGLAFGITMSAVSGLLATVRQLDLNANSISNRTDAGGIAPGSWINRSADGSVLWLLKGITTYNAATDSFSTVAATLDAQYPIAVNRNGTLFSAGLYLSGAVLYGGSPGYGYLYTFTDVDSGIAFDAQWDVLYGVNTASDQIIAYDTNTFAEEFRIDIGEKMTPPAWQFQSGSMIASPDGRYLALYTSTVRLVDIAARTSTPMAVPTPTPIPVPTPGVSVVPTGTTINEGGSMTFQISARPFNPSHSTVVNYSMTGTAVNGTHYALSGTPNQVTIPANNVTGYVDLTALLTGLRKGSETATLTITPGSGYTVSSPSQTTVTIRNVKVKGAKPAKPPKRPTLTLSVSAASIDEGSTAIFTVMGATIDSTQPITVNYSLGGTATQGSQYTLSGTAGQITIPIGSSSASVTLNAPANLLSSGSETVTMKLGASSAYKLGKTKAATVTINNVP